MRKKLLRMSVDNLNMFLEAVETDADYDDEGDALEDVKSEILKLKKKGATVDEIIDAMSGESADLVGKALVDLGIKEEDGDEEDCECEDCGDDEKDIEEAQIDPDQLAKKITALPGVVDDEAAQLAARLLLNPEAAKKVSQALSRSDLFKQGDNEDIDNPEELEEATFSRTHYQKIAAIIGKIMERTEDLLRRSEDLPKLRRIAGELFSDMFAQDNPRFDKSKFLAALGVEETDDEAPEEVDSEE